RLGLAPASPSWPIRGLLPRSPTAILLLVWQPTIAVPYLGRLTSPAALLMLSTLAADAYDNADGGVANSDDAHYRHGESNQGLTMRSSMLHPIGWLSYHVYHLRTALLQCLGLSVGSSATASSRPGDEGTRSDLAKVDATKKHKLSSLSCVPVQYLASTLDQMLVWSITLPLHSLVLRAVALSYAASPLPKTSQAVAAIRWLSPFSKMYSPNLLRGGALANLAHSGDYFSKIGLGVAIQTALNALLFGGLYAVVRSRETHHAELSRPGSVDYHVAKEVLDSGPA
ncbi:hypothetical protein LTR53_011936, partial [Teratosphaeriaceae sp. CCFEE 6253]